MPECRVGSVSNAFPYLTNNRKTTLVNYATTLTGGRQKSHQNNTNKPQTRTSDQKKKRTFKNCGDGHRHK